MCYQQKRSGADSQLIPKTVVVVVVVVKMDIEGHNSFMVEGAKEFFQLGMKKIHADAKE